MRRPIDEVIGKLAAWCAEARHEPLKVTHLGAGQGGTWAFTSSYTPREIRLHSPDGDTPFVIDAEELGQQLDVRTVSNAVEVLRALLRLPKPDPVLCSACGARFLLDDLAGSIREMLENRYRVDECERELAMLFKVQAFRERGPEASPSADDQEVIEYLECHHFDLEPRLKFVSEHLMELKPVVRPVRCTTCGKGQLKLDPGSWTPPGAVT